MVREVAHGLIAFWGEECELYHEQVKTRSVAVVVLEDDEKCEE